MFCGMNQDDDCIILVTTQRQLEELLQISAGYSPRHAKRLAADLGASMHDLESLLLKNRASIVSEIGSKIITLDP